MQYLLTDLENAIIDFKNSAKVASSSYIAIIKNDYTKKECNRTKYVEFIIIEGNDLFDAIEDFNSDLSHGSYIDLDFESEVFFEKHL